MMRLYVHPPRSEAGNPGRSSAGNARRFENLYRALLECTSEGIFGLDLRGHCTFINAAGATLLGYQPDEVIGRQMHELIHHTRRDGSPYPREVCSIYHAFREGRACRLDDEILWRKDGSFFPAEFSSSPLYDEDVLQGGVVTFNDITERKRAEEVHMQLLDRVMLAQEQERQRLSRELHDETEQALASLLVGLTAVEELPSLEVVRQRARSLRGIVAHSLDELQRVVQGLRPMLLDEMGLAAALQRLCGEFTRAQGIRVELHVGPLSGLRVGPSVETALYRIVQEALTNTSKHAGATVISVLIQPTGSSLRLVVEDNGRGFDPEMIRHNAAQNGCFGLYGMEERAKLVGGVFTVESSKGRGTAIQVELPFSPGD